ncbi:MAG: iron donor protein CyaY [Nannocystaceae bacterium]|nr:iron donor protein CyaY [Nannocystaceae bacterium]
MNRANFSTLSSATLELLDGALGDLEHDDLDVDLGGDVLTLEFSDGTTFIINAHGAATQIWMAANRTAWHFDYQESSETWVAHKTGDELFETLSRMVGEQLGMPVEILR